MDGAKLKHWRLARAMTIRDLSSASGVDHSAISLMERGRRSPHPGTIKRLADALGIEPIDLLTTPAGPAPQMGKAAARSSALAAFGTPPPVGISVG